MDIKKFQNTIVAYYQKEGRDFPWRRTRDPYSILVSEVMLQQTQTHRVLDKYALFLKTFPTVRALARASVRDIFVVWQGLGYNRRALMLHEAAQIITKEFRGAFPKSVELLKTLPGVGHATASAVAAFAFDKQSVFIETNIRAVYIHFFFRNRRKVRDEELLPIIQKTLPRSHVREWYYALMDYGVLLKKKYDNPSRRSAHCARQSRFEGSNRQLRGAILKACIGTPYLRIEDLYQKFDFDNDRILKNIIKLEEEGFIKKCGKNLVLA